MAFKLKSKPEVTDTDGKPSVAESRKADHPRYEIGSGCYRTVYRIPGSRWVYKIENRYSEGTNANEYRNYLEWRDCMPHGTKLPEMHLLSNGVLAAEYIEGTHPDAECYPGYHYCEKNARATCFWTLHYRTFDQVITDVHSYNVIVAKDGTIYVIDLGEE